MISLTPSHIIEYLYCPRFTYFERVLGIPQFEEKNFKVMQGRNLHELKSIQNAEYLRQRIGVAEKRTNVYLTLKGDVQLRGEVDEVLFLKDGTAAPLDYKFAKWEGKIFETYQTQLLCYAWLIKENFNVKVARGYIVYARTQNKLIEMIIEEEHLQRVQIAANRILEIIQKNWYPNATKFKKRCDHCTYKNICTR
jgi:CRISPR-associated exonuclease Cas4